MLPFTYWTLSLVVTSQAHYIHIIRALGDSNGFTPFIDNLFVAVRYLQIDLMKYTWELHS